MENIIKNWKIAQEAGAVLPCPRCGKMTMKENLLQNALSRTAEIHICDLCGTYEAMRSFAGQSENLSEWAAVRICSNGISVQKKNEREFRITCDVSVGITRHDIDNIMATALEGGITGWCCEASVCEDEYLGEYASEQISRGGSLFLYDCEDDSEYKLTLDSFLKGLALAIKEGYGEDWIDDGYVDAGMIDAEGADVIVQYALFGEVVFG